MNRKSNRVSSQLPGNPGPPLSRLPSPRGLVSLKGPLRWVAPLLFLLYLVFGLVHASLVPTGATGYQNAPDEAAHVTFVRVVAQGQLPSRQSPLPKGQRTQSPDAPAAYEWHQPPLYYALDAFLLPFGERALRLFSLVCGTISLMYIYNTARYLLPDTPLIAVAALGVAALTPTHIAITSTVNNDPLLEACFSGALYVLTRAILDGWTPARMVGIGMAIGLAILSKVTGVLLLPVFAMAMILMWRNKYPARALVQCSLSVLGFVALLCGWWLVRNATLYGEMLPIRTFAASFRGTAQASDIAQALGGWGNYTVHVGQRVFDSFWAVFGTPRAARTGIPHYLPPQVYSLMTLASMVAFAGLTKLHLRRKIVFNASQISVIQILFSTILLVGLSFAIFLGQYYQTQGRYLYPAMLPIAILFASGYVSLFPLRYQAIATGVLLFLLAALSIAFLSYVSPSSPGQIAFGTPVLN